MNTYPEHDGRLYQIRPRGKDRGQQLWQWETYKQDGITIEKKGEASGARQKAVDAACEAISNALKMNE